MTFYQELQLSSVGSKQLIRSTTDKKEKRRHILIYNFKVYLVMAFCVAVVTLYSMLTGNDNSVVGVTVLLALLVLRQADFGIKDTWLIFYHGDFCYFDGRTAFGKYLTTFWCICHQCSKHFPADDLGMPQCDHV